MAKAKRKSTASGRKDNEPWEQEAPRGSSHTLLTPKKKAAAKRRASKAGRPYPNLVDNMRVASGKRKKTKSKAKSKSRTRR